MFGVHILEKRHFPRRCDNNVVFNGDDGIGDDEDDGNE